MGNNPYSYRSFRSYQHYKQKYKMKNLMAFGYYGGKRRLAREIAELLDYDNTDEYIELFGGSAAVILNKIPHKREVYVEKSLALCCFWQCISDKESSVELIGRLYDSGYDRDDFERCIKNVDEAEKSGKSMNDLSDEEMIDIAEDCFIVFTMSRDNAGLRFKNVRTGHCEHVNRVNRLIDVADRAQGAEIIHADALGILGEFRGRRTMIYMDPVYLPEAGRKNSNSNTLYRYDFNVDEHKRLLEIVREMDCRILISGYDDDTRLYDRYLLHGEGLISGKPLRDWVRYEIDAISYVGQGNKFRTEVLWANYT